jgi:phosphatidylserine decarboxylase
MDPNSGTGPKAGSLPHNALWLRTDEGDNVLLQFRGYRLGVPPKSFARYGERLGQGARCAYLRLTRYAELIVPPGTKLLVREGQRVTAGSDLVGKLHRP